MGLPVNIRRYNPDASIDYIGGVATRDPCVPDPTALSGFTASTIFQESFVITGLPAIVTQFANGLTATGGEYPDDGTAIVGTTAIAGGTTLALSSSAMQGNGVTSTLDPTGMLVAVFNGSQGGGEVREITGWNTNTPSIKIVNIAQPWTTGKVPQAGATFSILLDLRKARTISFGGENNTQNCGCTILPALYSYPYDNFFNVRAPRRMPDQLRTLYPLNLTHRDVLNSGYYTLSPQTIDVRGFLGAKVRFHATDGGTTSLISSVT